MNHSAASPGRRLVFFLVALYLEIFDPRVLHQVNLFLRSPALIALGIKLIHTSLPLLQELLLVGLYIIEHSPLLSCMCLFGLGCSLLVHGFTACFEQLSLLIDHIRGLLVIVIQNIVKLFFGNIIDSIIDRHVLFLVVRLIPARDLIPNPSTSKKIPIAWFDVQYRDIAEVFIIRKLGL